MRIILHIGLNKTGTSSLQGLLAANPEGLARKGWVYPAAGRIGDAHHGLTGIAGQGVAALRQFREAVAAEAGERAVFLSTETLHETLHVPRLAEAFAGDEVGVVIFLRDHVDYLSSWYREDVQSSGLCCDFASYAVLKRKLYAPILTRWAQAFGRDALHVRDYNRATLRNGSSVDEVLDGVLGIGDRTGWNPAEPEDNPSVSGNLLFFKRLANNFVDRDAAAALRDEIQTLSRLDPEFRRPMAVPGPLCRYLQQNQFRTDILRLEREFGFALSVNDAARAGAALPDMDRLRPDHDRIMEACRDQGLAFGPVLARIAPACVL